MSIADKGGQNSWTVDPALLPQNIGQFEGTVLNLAVPAPDGSLFQARFHRARPMTPSGRAGKSITLSPDPTPGLHPSSRIHIDEAGRVHAMLRFAEGAIVLAEPRVGVPASGLAEQRIFISRDGTLNGGLAGIGDSVADDTTALRHVLPQSSASSADGTRPGALTGAAFADTIAVDLAVEVPVLITNRFTSPDEARSFMEGLLAIVNGIYETEVAIRLDVSRLKIWDGETQPFIVSTGPDGAYSLARFYESEGIAQGRAAVLAIADRPAGAAIRAGSLCTSERFAVAGLERVTDYSNLSIGVVAHELGHILGGLHTHWDLWPGGAMDNCDTNWNATGTIMSWCGTIVPTFDAFNKRLIRTATETMTGGGLDCKPGTYSGPSDQEVSLLLREYGVPATGLSFNAAARPGSALPADSRSLPSGRDGRAVHAGLPFGVFDLNAPGDFKYVTDGGDPHATAWAPIFPAVGTAMEFERAVERGFTVSARIDGLSAGALNRFDIQLCTLLDHRECFPLASDVTEDGSTVEFGDPVIPGIRMAILPGAYNVLVQSPHYRTASPGPMVVDVAGDLDLGTIHLVPTGVGIGTGALLVRTGDWIGSGVPDVEISLTGNATLSARTDQTGFAIFHELPQGLYHVTAVHPEFSFTARSVQVTADQLTYSSFGSGTGNAVRAQPPVALGDFVAHSGTHVLHWGRGMWNRRFEYEISSTADFSSIVESGSTRGQNFAHLVSPALEGWWWRVRSRNDGGLSEWAVAHISATPVGTSALPDRDDDFALESPFPNPARSEVHFPIRVAQPVRVSLVILDVLGREVARVRDDEPVGPGRHEVSYPVHNLATGLYFVRLTAGNRVSSRALAVVK